jgi:hypothetical protein|tara:strand:- start:780 stop:1004 length:225 start_codon:yes stop_codon:yes gene_type:complete
MLGTDIVVMMGAFVGICAYFSYKSGMKDGYHQMAQEIAVAIVEVGFEKEKVEAMKLEVEEIQKECAKLMEKSKT